MKFESYTVLDRRNQNDAAKLVKSSNFIILGGGHVPTQNQFFGEIRLKELKCGNLQKNKIADL